MWTLPRGHCGTGEGKGKGKPRPARATLGVSGVKEGMVEGPPLRRCLCDPLWPGSGCTGGTVACVRRPRGVTGCLVPTPGTVGEGAGCRVSVLSKVPGGGWRFPARPRSPHGPRAGRWRWRRLSHACWCVRAGAYAAFSLSVGSVGVSNYIYFHKLELCFI